jgi:hypothetical protein
VRLKNYAADNLRPLVSYVSHILDDTRTFTSTISIGHSHILLRLKAFLSALWEKRKEKSSEGSRAISILDMLLVRDVINISIDCLRVAEDTAICTEMYIPRDDSSSGQRSFYRRWWFLHLYDLEHSF